MFRALHYGWYAFAMRTISQPNMEFITSQVAQKAQLQRRTQSKSCKEKPSTAMCLAFSKNSYIYTKIKQMKKLRLTLLFSFCISFIYAQTSSIQWGKTFGEDIVGRTSSHIFKADEISYYVHAGSRKKILYTNLMQTIPYAFTSEYAAECEAK